MAFDRIITIVLVSIGIGEEPDAAKYHDTGADTLGHIGDYFAGKLSLPNLQAIGLGNIDRPTPIAGVKPLGSPSGYFGKMAEISAGKDSMDGHWEMMGLPVTEPLGYFPNGFPEDLIKQIEEFSGRHVILNKPYSGTEAIKDYGEEQLKTGDLIVYTSGDSVLQIAAQTDVIPLEELYRICRYVRSITIDAPYRIGRVIARPYVGTDPTTFTRTSDRHDYTLKPDKPTDLDRLQGAGVPTYGIGKINDIFAGEGITKALKSKSSVHGMEQTIREAEENDFHGLCFVNLVDFDALWGHRRDPEGYAQELMRFDEKLGILLHTMREDDMLIITADHGNDPTYTGTDHTREQVPFLAWSPSFKEGKELPEADSFAAVGACVAENFGIPMPKGDHFCIP